VYKSEGVGRVRPTGLGDESGAGGGTGVIAIAATLALLATTRRKRWLFLLLPLGALAAVATGLGRVQLVGGVLAIVGYLLLTSSGGQRFKRPLRLLLVSLAIAIPFGVIFVSALGGSTFSRYENLLSGGASSASYKENELKTIPHLVSAAPFGFGLGTAGPAASFGGRNTELLEGHNVNAETTYNFIEKEVGLPGLIVWSATIVTMLLLAFRRIRAIADPELQIYLAAVFAPIFAMFFMSFEGPVSQSQVLAPFFWVALGVAAYWLAGPGWQAARRRAGSPARAPAAPIAS
jgi:O-antigen ligase